MLGAYKVGDYTEAEDGYWIGYEVERLESIPDGMVAITVPPQRYAVIRHEGANTEIKNSYETLHRWIADNGHVRILRAWHIEMTNENAEGEPAPVLELYDTIR